jgi:plastocyanin
MKLLAIAAVAAALAVPTATAALKAPAANTLTGTVGPGFTITLTQNGKKVAKLKAGKYAIKIADKAIDHNFHLKGPGVNKKTPVVKKVNVTWTVTLAKGKYTYVCDPHLTFMKGSFTVS